MGPSKVVLLVCCLLLWVLAACGRGAENRAVKDLETVVSETAADNGSAANPTSLIDTELLRAMGVDRACDHAEGVEFFCESAATFPQLQVDTDGSGFARWRLFVNEATQPLTGDETLLIRVRQTGNLMPNLYLVERSGRRIAVSVGRYGFSAKVQGAEQEIAVPLREIRDEERQWLNFADVNEVQLVFEWAAMAGQFDLMSLQFASTWEMAVPPVSQAHELAAGLTLPTGFHATAIADHLREVTQLSFTTEETHGVDALWASTQSGRIWRYQDEDDDGLYEQRLLYATGFDEVVGLLPDPVSGGVWVGGRGQLIHTQDQDGNGVADLRETRLEGLPWGRHQNNGLAWNPGPDPFTGEAAYHWIYFGLGSTEDLEVGGEWNAQVLRFPRDGEGQGDLQTVSRGNRNPYGVLWAAVPVDPEQPDGETSWQLFASENGPDFNDAPDEVNHIRWQHDYGFPDQFGRVDRAAGAVDGDPYTGPIYPVLAHTSANGLAYVTNTAWPVGYRTLYVSLFGQVFSEEIVGHTVERISLIPVETADGDTTYRGIPSVFVAGLDRPLPLTTTPTGNLVVGDYATGVVYRVDYEGE